MLVESFAEELGSRGIRTDTLMPNLFATDRMMQLVRDSAPPVDDIALKRMGEPAEFDRMASVALSPAAASITGVAISIDGGLLMSS